MIRVRPATLADAPAIARVQVATWRHTYAGMVPQDYLDRMREEVNTAAWERGIVAASRAVVVAERTAEVIGFASGGVPARDPATGAGAELDAIYVAPSLQRQGAGRLLAAAVAGHALARGAASMVVWVLAGNRVGRSFYEGLGARLLPGSGREIDFGWGSPVDEVAYLWTDLPRVALTRRSPAPS